MTDISYGIGLIIGYLIPILIVALLASGVLRMTLEKVNSTKIRYSKVFFLIFIAYLISFVIGENLGEALSWVSFGRLLLICFLYLITAATIFYFFIEIEGEKLCRKDLAIHTLIQTFAVFIILSFILILVS